MNQFQNGKKLSITHSEYIGSYDSLVNRTLLTYSIYPGNSMLFPWLSTIAPAYETYLFNKLIFRWVPECGTQQVGSVYMAVDYDPTDPPPETLRDMMSMESAVSGSVWAILKHASKVGNLRKMKTYFTSPSFGSDSDRTTSVGTFNILRGGQPQNGQPLGKLFVDYSIELLTPQPQDVSLNVVSFRETSGGDSPHPFGSLISYTGLLPYGIVNNDTIILETGFEGIMLVNTKATAPGAPIFSGISSNNFNAFRSFTLETVDGYLQLVLIRAITSGAAQIEIDSAAGNISDFQVSFHSTSIKQLNWSLADIPHTDHVPWAVALDNIQSSFRLKKWSSYMNPILA